MKLHRNAKTTPHMRALLVHRVRTLKWPVASAAAAAGIARPRDFAAGLRAKGAEVAELVALPDHHRYTPRELERLERRRLDLGADAWVVTPKDAVKLDAMPAAGAAPAPWVVGVRVEGVDDPSLSAVLEQALPGRGVASGASHATTGVGGR